MARLDALLRDSPHGGPGTSTLATGMDAIERTLRLGLIERRSGTPGPVIGTTVKQAGLLDYARKNTVHVFAFPGMLADALLKFPPTDGAGLIRHCRQTYPVLREALFLPWSESEMERAIGVVMDQWRDRGLIRGNTVQYPATDGIQGDLLTLLATTVQPFLSESA
jgi:glycerol-3-phosphate O-acyltransferase